MGRKSRDFIRGNCNQDLIENKENIKEFAMAKDNKKKKSLKNNVSAKVIKNAKKNENIFEKKQKAPENIEKGKLVKSTNKTLKKLVTLNDPGSSTDVSINKKTGKAAESVLLHNSTTNTKRQHFSEIKKCQFGCTSHVPLITKQPVVVLYRIPYFDEDSSSTSSHITLDSASDIDTTLKDVEKAESSHSKSGNDLHKCKCHSNLLLKEAVVVLERLEENSTSMLKDDGKIKEVPNKSGKGSKRKAEEKNKSEDKNSSESTKSKKQKNSDESKSSKKEKIPDVTALDFSNDSKSPSGNLWNFKISSWNINGIRAWLEVIC